MLKFRHRLIFFLCCIACCLLTSCLKETPLLVVVDFDYQVEGEFLTTPLTLTLENTTTGADAFEWTFEEASLAGSKAKNPGKVTFTTPGEHKITLRAWNQNREHRKQITIRVDSVVALHVEPIDTLPFKSRSGILPRA